MRELESGAFIRGFAWPVPVGLRDAVGSCQFADGDVIHDTHAAFQSGWDVSKVGRSYQLLSSSVGSASETDPDVSSRFANNWTTQIRLRVYGHAAGQKQDIVSTNGRLYAAMWKGDAALMNEATPHPALPLLTASLSRTRKKRMKLDEVDLSQIAPMGFRGYVFILPYDETIAGLREKRLALELCLESLKPEASLYSPAKLQLGSEGEYAPTSQVQLYWLKKAELTEVKSRLKAALYKPSPNRRTKVDSFQVWRHGRLSRWDGRSRG